MTMTLPSMEKSVLIIRHKRRWYELKLPHAVFINGQFLGMVKDRDVRVIAPAGSYSLRVQFGGRIPIGKRGKGIDLSVSSTEQVQLSPQQETVCEFHDRERIWNLLFDIDLIVWVVSLFVTMPPLYRIISDVFFAVWLVRLIIIRKKYYKIKVVERL